jgi:hypothetical protein
MDKQCLSDLCLRAVSKMLVKVVIALTFSSSDSRGMQSGATGMLPRCHRHGLGHGAPSTRSRVMIYFKLPVGLSVRPQLQIGEPFSGEGLPHGQSTQAVRERLLMEIECPLLTWHDI